VEGLTDTWMVYRFKADIGRGLLQKDIHTRKHLRIVRTLDPSALELSHAMVNVAITI
jgi:arrestin-related trafficking adapter 4/5/7